MIYRYRSLYKTTLLTLAMLMVAGVGYAQYTVTGTVTDASSEESLPGVNVFDVNSQVGAVTNVDGEYSITIPNDNATTLRFSFIGYVTQNVEVNSNTETLDISLVADVANLDELVVTGLASSVKRSNLANSVTKIDADNISGRVAPQTLDNALQGKIAGVNIRAQSGAPGGGINVQLRGISTLGAGSSQPLYVIDGVYVNNDAITNGRFQTTGANSAAEDNAANRLADINPDEIESIEVLKGPSAAAIYGQRANSGVIIITTKRGSTGRTEVSFKQDIGFASALNLQGVPSWDQDKVNFVGTFLGFQGTASLAEVQNLFQEAEANNAFFDYEEILYGNEGLISETSISVSGGNEQTQFYVSGASRAEDGIINNTGFDRNSIRANLDHRISERVRLSSRSNFVKTDNQRGFTGNQNGTGASLGYSLSAIPNFAQLQQNPDGSFPDNPFFNDNPLAIVAQSVNDVEVDRFIQSVDFNADLYRSDNSSLSLNITGGLDILSFESVVWQPNQLQHQQAQSSPGDVVRTVEENLNTNLQGFLVYNTQLGSESQGIFSLTTQIGASRFDQWQNRQQERGQGLAFGQNNINQAAFQSVLNQFEVRVVDASFIGQQEVNWDDKIIGTVGARLDRSSLNTNQDEYYFFPKGSAAFNLSNFDFWSGEFFNQFKLRAAYGETGGLPSFGNTFRVVNGLNIDGRLASTVSTRSTDPNLEPERAQEFEFGADVSVLDNRVTLESTYYIKTVQDLILDLPTAASTGIIAIATNAADLENKGIELGLTVVPFRKQNFEWVANTLFWTNESEITSLDIPAFTTGGFGPGLGAFLIQEGFSPTTIVATPSVDGPSLFTEYGDAQPDFQMSFNHNFTIFRNIEANFLLHWKKGGQNINLSQLLTDVGGTSPDWNEPVENDILGTETIPKGFSRLLVPSGEAYIQDADYVKLREAGLYYNVPLSSLQQWTGDTIRKLRLGVSGTDLFMWTPYDSYDPEVSVFGTDPVNNAVEVTPFPTSRRLMFHLAVDF